MDIDPVRYEVLRGAASEIFHEGIRILGVQDPAPGGAVRIDQAPE